MVPKRGISPSQAEPVAKKLKLLSINPSTTKNRNWSQSTVNKAKRADSSNVSYYIVKYKKSDKYKNTSAKDKPKLLAAKREEILNKRYISFIVDFLVDAYQNLLEFLKGRTLVLKSTYDYITIGFCLRMIITKTRKIIIILTS